MSDMDNPPCPECETNVLVRQLPNGVCFCHSCQNSFNKDGEITDRRQAPKSYLHKGHSNTRVHKIKPTHATLLAKLQEWDRNYFNATNVTNVFDTYEDKSSVGYLFSALNEHEYITTWGSGNSKRTWYLTDKGKEVNPKEVMTV